MSPGNSSLVFTAGYREYLRSLLLQEARADDRITGAAVTGSASVGREDRWSDIDLSFGIRAAAEMPQAMADWTDRMYREHEAVHHFDVPSGASIYRVFLLRNTLQVDLAFSPREEFAARGPTFRLVFGEAADGLRSPPPPDVEDLIGLAWLYALHARACLRRGQLWRAEYMVSAIRDSVVALACLRLGLPHSNGRGADELPAEVIAPLEAALVRRLETGEIARAFRVLTDRLLVEIHAFNEDLARRVEPALLELCAPTFQSPTDPGGET